MPELRVFHRVDSTNDAARRLAETGAPAGTVVIADEQTHGRGRRGRVWTTTPGAALLLSVVFRPPRGAPDPVLTLRLGLAVAQAIETATRLEVDMKWPNDLQVGGRKVAGLLCEASMERGRLPFLVAGVGINVESSDDHWPPDVRARATSLAAAADPVPPMEDLAEHVIREMLSATASGSQRLTRLERERIEARDILAGRLVAVDGRPAGRVAGIADDGALRVMAGTAERRVLGGVVRILNAEEAEAV